MYLGYRQYQLLFDLVGLVLLGLAVTLAVAIAVRRVRRPNNFPLGLIGVLLVVASVQFYRGWMAPVGAWLPMLGALEAPSDQPGHMPVQELSMRWDSFAGSMRGVDWWLLSRTWNVCHGMWEQKGCVFPKPSEEAFGVTREIIDDAVSKFRAGG